MSRPRDEGLARRGEELDAGLLVRGRGPIENTHDARLGVDVRHGRRLAAARGWQDGAKVRKRSTAISRKQPQPEGGQAPVVQRIRIRYAKRGPLRFTSHRDFARAFERAVKRAGVPIAFSQGFTPHPKISYASAAPTGTGSEAEYLEIGLQRVVDPAWVVTALDAALSPGLDVLDAVEAAGREPGGPDRRLAMAAGAAGV